MNKVISISLLFLYLLASVGFTVKAHYCGGDLASVSLFQKSSCCCEDNNSGKKDDCCKDEIKSFKIADDQNINEQSKITCSILDADHNKPTFPFYFQQVVALSNSKPDAPLHGPPDQRKVLPSWKLNHSFLFYC